MQLDLTKELATAVGRKPVEKDTALDPLFSWTAGWYAVNNRRGIEDTLIAVNNAARFVIALYPVEKKLSSFLGSFPEIIRQALEAEQFNPALIEKYLADLGDKVRITESDEESSGRLDEVRDLLKKDFPYWLAPRYGAQEISDKIGHHANVLLEWKAQDDPKVQWKQPSRSLAAVLSEHYGLPAYRYAAFAIDCTLDLIRYQAIRRIVVPAYLPLPLLHFVLQDLYDFENGHLHAFFAGRSSKSRICYVSHDVDLDYRNWPEDEYTVRDLYAKGMGNHAIYEYDFGDSWKIDLHLTKRLRSYDKALPWQLSAEGQSPLEDCGGAWGFAHLLDVLDNPRDPDYESVKQWVGSWSPDLAEDRKGEFVLRFY